MDEDFNFGNTEFNFDSKLIRNDSKNIYNRLRSIIDDANFVLEMTDQMPTLALIGKRSVYSLSDTISKLILL